MVPTTPWIRSALADDFELILHHISGSHDTPEKVSKLFAAEGHDFPILIRDRIARSGLNPEEAHRLSSLFTSDRIRALGRIQPILPATINARLLFLPLATTTAFAARWGDEHLVLFTGGLFELLRSHAVNSIWSGRVSALEKQLDTTLVHARATIQYLNLRSVLFMAGRLPLLQIDEEVPSTMRDSGWRFAEAAVLFVILHELGHAHFATMAAEEKEVFAAGVRLRMQESLTPSKIEELFADQFVLRSLPAELGGPMVHASLTFFSLLGFLEAGGLLAESEHPLAPNRLSSLLDYLHRNSATADWSSNAESQLEAIISMRSEMAEIHDRESGRRLDRLADFAQERESALDWRSAVKGVCELDAALERKDNKQA